MITVFLHDYGFEESKFGFLSWIFQNPNVIFNICLFVSSETDKEFYKNWSYKKTNVCKFVDIIDLGISREEVNIPKMYNLGIKKYSDSETLIFCAPNIMFQSSFLQNLINFLHISRLPYSVIGRYQLPNYKWVGEKLQSPEKFNYRRNLDWLFKDDILNIGSLNPIPWGCIISKSEILKDIGGFDTNLLAHWEADIDRRAVDYCRNKNLHEMMCFRFYNTFYGVSIPISDLEWEYHKLFNEKHSEQCLNIIKEKKPEDIILEDKLVSYEEKNNEIYGAFQRDTNLISKMR